MDFHKAKPVSLKSHLVLTEKWLQQRIVDDPSLLGLGDLVVKDVERRQPRAGRLDLLMSDPETGTRYEVELQLGATDEAHIIRTIEYWDIEKVRYPQYEHVAVIVAEDITSRFLNVINLFNKTIPLIAIQMRALEVAGVLTLHATTVLDLMPRGSDEDDEPGQATDRAYWELKGTPEMVGLADKVFELVKVRVAGVGLKYNKFYIGMTIDGVADNFMQFRPRKDVLIVEFRIPSSDELDTAIDDAGLDRMAYDKRWGRYRIRIKGPEVSMNGPLLGDLIHRASGSPALDE